MNSNSQAKKIIAAKVADMISDGDSLFLDVGSTTSYVAKALRNHQELFVVTNSVEVAHILATRNNNRVFLAAGELRPHDGGAFGEAAVSFIQQFNTQYAILSVGAINVESGFMLHDLQEAALTREAMSNAQVTVVASDSSKFGHRAPIRIGNADEVDVVVTDQTPDASISKLFESHDIDLVVANEQ